MKTRFARALALSVVRELLAAISPACERVIVAGSLRRKKADVGDAEILYIPKTEVRKISGDMFATGRVDLADLAIRELIESGILALRLGENGSTAYGPKNKLLVHVSTGLPVDLFATSESSWFNYLVCRTGSKENNMRIAEAARAKGWRWNPYGSGFTGGDGHTHAVTSEQEVYALVGLPYPEPWER